MFSPHSRQFRSACFYAGVGLYPPPTINRRYSYPQYTQQQQVKPFGLESSFSTNRRTTMSQDDAGEGISTRENIRGADGATVGRIIGGNAGVYRFARVYHHKQRSAEEEDVIRSHIVEGYSDPPMNIPIIQDEDDGKNINEDDVGENLSDTNYFYKEGNARQENQQLHRNEEDCDEEDVGDNPEENRGVNNYSKGDLDDECNECDEDTEESNGDGHSHSTDCNEENTEVKHQDLCSRDEDEIAEITMERAQNYFPGLDLTLEDALDAYDECFGLPLERVKAYIVSCIESILDAMEKGRRAELMKGDNAAKLCLALGMNEEVVRIKFEAVQKFEEQEGRLDFKLSNLDAIYHLIDNLDYDNPFGKANNCIEMYNEEDNVSYMGVDVNRQNVNEKIKCIETALEEHRLQNCFIHGTTATTLHKVSDGEIEPSDWGRHDFGHGLYCFRGQLLAALAYALYRSWPHLPNKEKGTNKKSDGGHKKRKKKAKERSMNIGCIRNKDNPSLIIFPYGKEPEGKTFNVGYTKYPYSDEELRLELGKKRFKTLKEKSGDWEQKSEAEFKWKHFVKIARTFKKVPSDSRLFYGWLHDSDCVDGTNRCGEPKIDEDGWLQYCFTSPVKDLQTDKGMVFIELHINWADWVGVDVTV